ncbi:MAG: molybdenum ABC transporter ATP-binding protein [Brucellaceae bacterium]|nr:molybdenum ABC transporter ATP-binding protein [Brucellaceae bacterium]
MLSVRLAHQLGTFSLDAAFEAPAGVTVLFGRSGSGKSTIIRAVAGLMTPPSGRITVDGRTLLDTAARINLPPHRRSLGTVFQEGRLFPHLTVRQNLKYGQWFAARAGNRGPHADFGHVVEMLGIGHLMERRPALLSGGEKQRVTIGRALLSAPQLILADEPLSALDDQRKAEILPYFERLRDEAAVPLLYVSHSASEVARLATTVVVLENGRVTRQGSAAEVLGDPSVLPAGAREAGAVLEAAVAVHHADGLTELAAGGEKLFLPSLAHPLGTPVRVRIAAHDVMLATVRPTSLSALNILGGTVSGIRQGEGPGAMVAVETAAGRVLARVTRRSVDALGLVPGKPVFAVIKSVSVAPGDIGISAA